MVQSYLKPLAGVAEVAITPAAGTPLMTRPSTGVHDDLFARALVIRHGEQSLAIVSLDLVGLSFDMADELRGHIRERTGITATFLNCSHTHSAPFTIPYSMIGWNWFIHEGRPWRDALFANIREVVCRAAGDLCETALRVGRAPVRIGTNRRLELTRDAAIEHDDPQVGVVPWVDVLRVDRADGTPLALLFSHAAHPVIVHHASDLISADYPGAAVATVKERFGSDTVAMFAQACGGDINGDPLNAGFDAAERAGKLLGEAAVKAASASTPLDLSEIRFVSTSFGLPFRDFPSPQECEQRLHEMEGRLEALRAQPPQGEELWWTEDTVLCLRDLRDKIQRNDREPLRFDIRATAVGDQWCLLAMPHEVLSEYQLWIDRTSPFQHTMVLAYTHACESYIPSDRDIDIGGPEAAAFPSGGAPLQYCHRLALRKGVEGLIKERITLLWQELASTHRRQTSVHADS